MKNIKTQVAILVLMIFGTYSLSAQLGKCKGKYFGNIVSNNVQSSYNGLWNQMTMENGSKWQSTEGTKGKYNFGTSDIGFNWAKNNNGLFKYHCLMWGAQTPGWVSTATSAEIQAEIPIYFKAVADHYNAIGGLKLIDVLNEPINTPVASNLKNALTAGYKAEPANAGDLNNQYGWAIWCFQLARKNFPNAVLLINEFNIEMNWNNCRTPYIAMSSAIKNAPNLTDGKKNLIDGVGLQAHGVENLTAANFKKCIDDIWNGTGLPCHITEFDATANPNEAKQQQVYSTLIPVAWEHPHVAGITFWGFIEGQTWITGSGLLNSNGTDRSAMTWLKSYMAGQTGLSCCPAPAPFANCTSSVNPSVSFTVPADNSTFTQGSSITLTATATTPSSTVKDIKFYDGTILLNTDNATPYTFIWAGATAGTHIVKAVVTDNAGKTAESTITIKVNVPQGPYNGTWNLIPGTIQAENFDEGGNGFAYMDDSPGSAVTPVVNFRTTEDVDIENCTDAGTGYNLGYTTAGEWLEYSVDVQKAGEYTIGFRAACSGDARTVSLSMDGIDIAKNVAIPNTAGWQTWQTVNVMKVNLKAGKQILKMTIGATDYVNLNYLVFTLTKELKQEPYGSALPIPGKIEAEEYDLGGEGLAYHEANTNGNEGLGTLRNDEVDIENCTDTGGGFNIGYSLTGEWLEYTVNVSTTDKYNFQFRVAKDGTGGLFHAEIDGVNVTGSVAVPNTGGWQMWQTVEVKNINLTAGTHIMKIVFDSDYTNFNYVEVKTVITGIENATVSAIQLYPNPFTSEGININVDGTFTYKLLDVNGILMEEGNFENKKLLGKNVEAGIYFLTIENQLEKQVFKVVKH